MDWIEENILKSYGKQIYSEKYGLGKIEYERIRVNGKYLNDIFIELVANSNNYINVCSINREIYCNPSVLFDMKLFEKTGSFGYSLGYSELNTISIKINFIFEEINCQNNKSYEVIYSSKDDFNNDIDKYILTDSNNVNIINARVNDIKIGKYFYLQNNGKCEVTKLYEFPNTENNICEVTNFKGENIKIIANFKNGYIGTNDSLKLYYLPYIPYYNKLDDFNKSFNELALFPNVEKKDYNYTIYWRGIEEAAKYVVSIYVSPNLYLMDEIYHLYDFEVERNKKYLTITNLVGNHYFFIVKAENREGKIIAQSGILREGLSNTFK